MRGWPVLVVLVLGAACTKRNPGACCTTDADCEAKGLPSGTDCASGETCVNNGCIPITTCQADSDCTSPTPLCEVEQGICIEACESPDDCGNQACDATTQRCRPCVADDECSTGYCALLAGECLVGDRLVPKYLPSTICYSPGNPDPLTFSANATVGANASCSSVVTQSGAADICVIHHSSIRIDPGVTVTLATNLVAFVADGDITVDGGISAVGIYFGSTTPSTTQQLDSGIGGGGAGFKTQGGGGGGSANGGPPVNAVLAPVFLGGPGTAAPSTGGPIAPRSVGGGGVMLVSCKGTVSVAGTIRMSGSGGAGGGPYGGGYLAGAGGGAGGQILLQAKAIEVTAATGSISVNGGSGGAGHCLQSGVGNSGNSGGAVCAATTVGTNSAGDGGAGGCVSTPPAGGTAGDGNSCPGANWTGGGGGGSVGFIRIAMPPGATPTLTTPGLAQLVEPLETIEIK